MQVSNYGRPGVYSSYSTSTLSSYSAGRKSVGIVACQDGAVANEVKVFASVSEAEEFFGSGVMVDMVEVALSNGALSAYCVAVGEKEVAMPEGAEDLETVNLEGEGLEDETPVEPVMELDYETAFALLELEDGISMILCDSTDLEVHLMLCESVKRASEGRKERIGVVALEGSLPVGDCCAHAQEINHQRMVLVAGKFATDTMSLMAAAAVAGVLACETDPALPISGLELSALEGMTMNYTDSEVELLIASGVLCLEQSSGVVSVIRGVTTKTLLEGDVDYTWRDLTTILVVDDVIPALRTSLRGKFQRSKNTEVTRGSIRSQVVMDLERKMTNEIIVDYGDITVEASGEDPSTCVVSFSFAVAHGLNQIWLSANVQI